MKGILLNHINLLIFFNRARLYKIYIQFEDMEAIKYSFDIEFKHIKEVKSYFCGISN